LAKTDCGGEGKLVGAFSGGNLPAQPAPWFSSREYKE